MAKEAYIEHNFSAASLKIIEQADAIITDYQRQGFRLTLRQLYYQFVARDLIPNSQRSYKRLGGIIVNARLAGYIDWMAIEDRTRRLLSNSHWRDERSIISSVAPSFAIDKWERQPNRLEVWIEKEALSGVIQPVCERLDVPFFACKGYPSASSTYAAAKRMAGYSNKGQDIHILHLGDHDPSGIDMTRDISDRIRLLAERMIAVDRLALNFDQIELYQPPPNPTKMTDSRAGDYVAEFGYDSWELDALNPERLSDLIQDAVFELRDAKIWAEDVEREENMTSNLEAVYTRWDEIVEHLELK